VKIRSGSPLYNLAVHVYIRGGGDPWFLWLAERILYGKSSE